MNKRHPTLVKIHLRSQDSMIYLFKSWKSAIKYLKLVERTGWIKVYYFYPRNPDLGKFTKFAFLPW
jgi:hypothetical protein